MDTEAQDNDDQASQQIADTEALLTILYNLGSVEMVIFLGDHNQLDPTVLSRHAKLVPGDQTSLPYNISVHSCQHRSWTGKSITACVTLFYETVPHDRRP